MSNHMSAKALELWSRQVEGGKLRRLCLAEARAVEFEVRRVVNVARGLEVKAERSFVRKVERGFSFLLFLYLQAMTVTYLWWWLG